MPTQPLVSIVTPSYNQADFLAQTLQSVLGQDYPHIEYIVVDGGSTDGTVDLLRRYDRCLGWWVSEPDRGQTDALNKGFARARGEILGWLNADDLYAPYAVREAVAYLQAHPEVGLVYGDAAYIDEEGRILGRYRAGPTDYRDLLRGRVPIPQQAAFFRAALWRQVGPLNPRFYFAMDYDLWVRLARITRLAHVPRLWGYFRLHLQAKTFAAGDRCWPEMMQVFRREGGKPWQRMALKYALRRAVEPLWNLRWRWWLRRAQARATARVTVPAIPPEACRQPPTTNLQPPSSNFQPPTTAPCPP